MVADEILGKKTILIFSNFSSKYPGWHGALSMNRIMVLFSRLSRLLSFDGISMRISLSTQAFGWLKYWHGNGVLSWIPLKHLGLADLPMMIGFSFPPLALTKNAHVSLSFDFLPPVQIWETSVSDLFGSTLKNWPVSSIFQISQGYHPCKISGILSCHKLTVSSLTSPDSHEINFAFMPVFFLKRSSHPFEALNSSAETSRASAILVAFSCNTGPNYWNVLGLCFSKPVKQSFINLFMLRSSCLFHIAVDISLIVL